MVVSRSVTTTIEAENIENLAYSDFEEYARSVL